MTRKLVIAGIVITGVGLALLGYLDPVIRILFFGQSGAGTGITFPSGAASFTRTGTLAGNFTGGLSSLTGRGGAISLVSIATIIVFAATVIGLLLTIAGSFAAGRPMPRGAGPSPAGL